MIWVLREIFEGSSRVVVFSTKKECVEYAQKWGLKLNPTDEYGYDLEDGEYSINKDYYFMERAC